MHRSNPNCDRDISVVYNSNYVDVDVKKVTCSPLEPTTPFRKRGKSGAKGEIGESGAKGESGGKGETGANGEKGQQGIKGDSGPRGTFGGVVDKDILPYKNSVISIGNVGLNFKRMHCESVFVSGNALFIQDVPIEVKNSTINLPVGTTINNKNIGETGPKGETGTTGETGTKGETGATGPIFNILVTIKNEDLSNNYYILPDTDDVHIYTIDVSFNYYGNEDVSRNNIVNNKYVKLLMNDARVDQTELILFEEDVSTMIHTKSNGAYKQY